MDTACIVATPDGGTHMTNHTASAVTSTLDHDLPVTLHIVQQWCPQVLPPLQLDTQHFGLEGEV